ncbi:MAG TPA: hypothetical protein VM120_12435 [Bryobacteraceae bacterium]|nr:hypothetical protein [Bryobacteraceae bacterium]
MSRRVFALSICFTGVGWTQSPKPAAQPCIVDAEDHGPPRLKRGKPGERKGGAADCVTLATPIGGAVEGAAAEGREGSTVEVKDGVPVENRGKPLSLLEKVSLRAATYSENLPNFICEQLIRRYQSGYTRHDWKLQDTVQIDVMYVDGKENYKNYRRNSKPVKLEDAQRTGTWSAGEYGSVLQDILSPATNAKFRYRKLDTIGGVETEVHEYVVEKANSHWDVKFGGQSTKPKYRGAIWVNPKDLMVRRIEMEALELEPSYPVSHVEMTLEYGPVKINQQFYTLPTKSENLACFTQSRDCVRNEMEFRNYRKFSAEATISTTETNIIFDGEEKPGAKKAAEPKKKK